MIDGKVGSINLINPFTKIYQSSIYALKEIVDPILNAKTLYYALYIYGNSYYMVHQEFCKER